MAHITLDITAMKEAIGPLAKKHGLSFALLFGSHATGKTHRQSDIDIGVLADDIIDLHDLIQIEMELATVLKVKGVELSDMKTLPPHLLKSLAQNSAVLYEHTPGACDYFRLYAYRQYFAVKPLFRLKEKKLKQFLQSV